MRPHARGLLWALLWALPVLTADQAIKGLVARTLSAGESPVLVPGVLRLTYTENPAAAFGLFGHLPPALFISLIFVVVGVFVLLVWPFMSIRAGVMSAALVLGGAAGNLVDRLTRHFVIDYLQFPFKLTLGDRTLMWPVFNLADVCVVVGIGLLVLLIFRVERQSAPAPANPPGGDPS